MTLLSRKYLALIGLFTIEFEGLPLGFQHGERDLFPRRRLCPNSLVFGEQDDFQFLANIVRRQVEGKLVVAFIGGDVGAQHGDGFFTKVGGVAVRNNFGWSEGQYAWPINEHVEGVAFARL